MAVVAAREKAAAMAEKLGLHLGRVVTLEDEPEDLTWYGGLSNASPVMAPSKIEFDSGGGLSLGQIPFRASVRISFELK